MVLTCFEFEEVECVGESLDSCDQVDFYSQRKRGSDGVETRCYEVSYNIASEWRRFVWHGLLAQPGHGLTSLSRLARACA